jgi:hypothetical protein
MELNKPIILTNKDLRLELTDEYKNWITAYEQGNFLVDQYINNIAPIRLKDNKLSKVLLELETGCHLPYLFFGASCQPYEQALGIYKHKEGQEECICINFSPIITKKEGLTDPGRYSYFEGKIILGKDIKLEKEPTALRNIIELNKSNLRFIFDQGRGRIFFEKKELTIGLGVYTSVRSSGIWYDSYQTIWQTDQKDDNKIIVSGDWPYIPISQIWQIE